MGHRRHCVTIDWLRMDEALFVAGTIPFLLLGVGHLALTIRDLRRPTSFAPTDESLLPALRASGVKIMQPAPGAQSMWRAWMGANLTHSLGLIVFPGLLLSIALHDADLVDDITTVRPLSIAVAVVYTSIAVRFWFLPAAITAGVGATCFATSAVL